MANMCPFLSVARKTEEADAEFEALSACGTNLTYLEASGRTATCSTVMRHLAADNVSDSLKT
jgi:hypothetical protein